MDYGKDIDWTPELELDNASPAIPARGGKRLQQQSGFPWLRALLILLSLALVAVATYILLTKVWPLVQTRFFENDTTQGQDPNKDAPAQGGNVGQASNAAFRLAENAISLTQPGETKQLSATYEGEGEMGALTWNSSDPAVVSVSNEGIVTAIAPGNAVVSALRQDGSQASCDIACLWDTNAPVASLYLSSIDFTIGAGEPNVTLKVLGTSEKPVWAVENPAVVTVSPEGVVTYVGPGQTKITATVAGQTLTCVARGK